MVLAHPPCTNSNHHELLQVYWAPIMSLLRDCYSEGIGQRYGISLQPQKFGI